MSTLVLIEHKIESRRRRRVQTIALKTIEIATSAVAIDDTSIASVQPVLREQIIDEIPAAMQ